MNTTKVWKRVVSVIMSILLVVGMIPLTELMTVDTYAAGETKTIYFKPGVWETASAWYQAWVWGGSAGDGIWVTATNSDGSGTYEFVVPSDATGMKILRKGPSQASGNWDCWNQTGDLTFDGTCFTMSDWSNGSWSSPSVGYFVAGSSSMCGEDWNTTADQMTLNADGTYSITFYNVAMGDHSFKVVKGGDWGYGSWPSDNYTFSLDARSNVTITFDPSASDKISVTIDPVAYERQDEMTLSSNSVFYVDVDIVDYLNDNRVENKETGDYYTDNQGIWLSEGDAPYSYLNDLISQQATNSGDTYPLYFGPLFFTESRYSRIVNDSTKYDLKKWNSAANVALSNNDGTSTTAATLNTDAAVQGLVHNRLVNGNLADPVNQTELLYFSKTAADTWTNQGGDYKVMDYYANLHFPFKASYDGDTRVTTYSYNSAEDYAVYYDYTNSQLYASSTHVKDKNGKAGFYPLNEPDDADNEVNNGFGMKFTVDFTVGEGGILANGTPVTFDFTGDDDVWVFIDGVLVLDMGGAHAKAHGSIDFSDLTATVTDAANVAGYDTTLISGSTTDWNSYDGKGLANWIYHDNGEDTERAALAAGEESVTFETLGLTDFDYSAIHTMTVFYMERGMIESNFKMEFTMVPVPSGMTLSKELNDDKINAGILDEISAVEDYTFNMVATSPSDVSVAFSEFTLTEKNTGMATVVNPNGTTSGKTYTAAISGVTNDTYAHSFRTSSGQDAFIPGTTFKITETMNGVFEYSSTSWAVYNAKTNYSTVTSGSDSEVAEFTLGSTSDTVAQSYAVVFTNNIKLGELSVTKTYGDTLLADYDTRDYTFTLKLDLDGSGSKFPSKVAYQDLVYTINGGTTEYKTDANGQFTLKHGQTATFTGIPHGATYEVTEASSDLYYVSASSGLTGTVQADTDTPAQATITNKTTVNALENKIIYVTKGVSTTYAPDDLNATILDCEITAGDLTVSGGDSSFTVVGNAVGQAGYSYVGTGSDGSYVTGTVTVFVYEATEETYVFDFGLTSDLAETTGSGLFEDGTYRISGDNATATLISVEAASGNSQTTITFSGKPTISEQGVCSASVIFKPTAFMSKVETYTYTVYILADGVTQTAFVNSGYDPEMGTVVSSTIRVMPANSVYYEDNFNVGGSDSTQKIVYSGSAPTSAPTMSQSNDQSGNYGYDDCYKGGYAESGGTDSATTLTGTYAYKNNAGEIVVVKGQYAYFTFTGTGFDLISNTDATAAGMAVYVFEADGYESNDLKYVTDASYTGTTSTLADKVYVNNYYNNGSLYQVPVVSVRLDARKTYTVYIQAASTNYGKTVTIDGLRIYDPLDSTSDYLAGEQGTKLEELRALYLNEGKLSGKVALAARVGSSVGVGIAKACTLLENMEDDKNYTQYLESVEGSPTTDDLKEIYVHGPNNEMYLPDDFGIKFSYKVTSSDWSLQLGAKALSSSKTVSIYACKSGGTYALVDTLTVESTTDMYYDLTGMLSEDKYNQVGTTYDIIIISDSEDSLSNFVSLTTVKYSGINLP